MNAWAAAVYLVERGVPSRLAHEAVGKAVALAVERGCDLQKLPLADLQAIHSSFDAGFTLASDLLRCWRCTTSLEARRLVTLSARC